MKFGELTPFGLHEETEKNRKTRMQDITQELEEWILTENNTLNIQSVEKVTAKIYSLQLHKHSRMPVVFLQDPLGVAFENAKNYKAALEELEKQMERISQKPFYKSAALIYPLFFDPRSTITNQEELDRSIYDARRCHLPQPQLNIFGKCGEVTEKEKLVTLLEVGPRKKMRARIRDLKKIHVEWLDGIVNGHPITRPDFIDVNTALTDYFSNENYRYLQSWMAIKGLITGIDADPCAIDGRLDIPEDKDRTPYESDPGCKYLESLMRPWHPLHGKLFPTEQQAPVESDGPVQQTEEDNDGMGSFRPASYIAAFTGAAKVPGFLSQEARRTAELIDQILSDLVSSFGRQWEKALEKTIDYDIKTITRLAKASYADDLVGLRFSTNLQGIPENRLITHANISKSRWLSAEKANKALRSSRNSPLNHIIFDKTGNAVAADNPRLISQYEGKPFPGKDWTEFKSFKTRHFKTEGFNRVNLHLTTIPEDCQLAYKLKNMEAKVSRDVKLKAGMLKGLRIGIPPVVVVFEIWNLQSMVHALEYGTERSGAKRLADAGSAVADLSYAILQGIVEVAGAESKATQTIKAVKIPIGQGGLPALPALGAAAAFYSAALSFMDLLDNFDEHDNDAAIAHGIAAVGFALFGLGLLGQVAASSKVACLAPLAGFGPYTWAALGIVLVGVVIAGLVDDKPLEEWAKNGPFCKKKGSDDFKYLREDETLAYKVLVSCLHSPRIDMRRLPCHAGDDTKKGDLVVTVSLPNFKIGEDLLDIRTCIQIPKMRGRAILKGPQERLTHYKEVPITAESGQLTAIEFYYRDTSGHQSHTRWLSKARIFKAPDGIFLPDPERREGTGEVIDPKGKIPQKPERGDNESAEQYLKRYEEYQTKLDIIDPDVSGWAYADLSYREI